MDVNDGVDAIEDSETIYRRIPKSMGWYEDGVLKAFAFMPRKDDTTGLSVYRAKYKALAEAAQGSSRHGYYVAVLNAGKIRSLGLQIEPRPLENDPGHAEIIDLTISNSESDISAQFMALLARHCERVEGPFHQESAG